MNRQPGVHIMGTLLLFVLFSLTRDWMMTIITGTALLTVSIGAHIDDNTITLPGLILVSFLLPYSIGSIALDELYPLLFYTFVVIVPIVLYWGMALTDSFFTDKFSLALSVSYFVLVPIIFYSLLIFSSMREYLLDPVNQGPQAMVISGCAVLLFIIYYLKPTKT